MSKSMPETLKSSIYCPKRTPWISICLLFYIYVNMYITYIENLYIYEEIYKYKVYEYIYLYKM